MVRPNNALEPAAQTVCVRAAAQREVVGRRSSREGVSFPRVAPDRA